MKCTYIFLAILLYTSCQSNEIRKEDSIAVTLLYDPTDKRMVRPESVFPISLYGFDTQKEHAAFFKASTITDKVVNESFSAVLPPQSVTEEENENDNPLYRQKRIRLFYDEVGKAIHHTQKDTGTYTHSEVFRNIAKELTELHKQTYTKRYLILYSDLEEYSKLTVYRNENIDTNAIRKSFEKTKLLPDTLPNTHICCMFLPRDRNEDKKFMMYFELYKTILEKRGAQVYLVTQNNQ